MSRKSKDAEAPESIIELDKKKILEELNSKGVYQDTGVIIKKWDDDIDESFITETNKNGSRFIGVLNGRLERHGYGINFYKSGEKYLGNFEQDLPNRHGIYLWAPSIKGRNIQIECYHGLWNNNKKDKNGIYIWMNEPLNNKNFDVANFDAYIGVFDNDKFVRGTYLSKISDDYYLYHGNFDNEGKKTDDNAFFYSSKYDRVLHGKIEKDNFVNAYVSFFESDSGEIKNLVYCTFDNMGSVENIIMQNDLKPEDKKKEEDGITLFRNVILEVDYFGIIYNRFHEIKDFIREHANSMEFLEDKNKFPNFMSLCSKYSEENIYKNIEKKVFDKKVIN